MLAHCRAAPHVVPNILEHMSSSSVSNILIQMISERNSASELFSPMAKSIVYSYLDFLGESNIIERLVDNVIRGLEMREDQRDIHISKKVENSMIVLRSLTSKAQWALERLEKSSKFASIEKLDILKYPQPFERVLQVSLAQSTSTDYTPESRLTLTNMAYDALFHILSIFVDLLASHGTLRRFKSTELIEKALVLHIPNLVMFLEHDVYLLSGEKNWGKTRLEVAEFFVSCSKSLSEDFVRRIYDADLQSVLFKSLEDYENNTILHKLVTNFVAFGLLGQYKSVQEALLRDFRIIRRILDIWSSKCVTDRMIYIHGASTPLTSVVIHLASCVRLAIDRSIETGDNSVMKTIDHTERLDFDEFSAAVLNPLLEEEAKPLSGPLPVRELPFSSTASLFPTTRTRNQAKHQEPESCSLASHRFRDVMKNQQLALKNGRQSPADLLGVPTRQNRFY